MKSKYWIWILVAVVAYLLYSSSNTTIGSNNSSGS